jgi:hypothetical protein
MQSRAKEMPKLSILLQVAMTESCDLQYLSEQCLCLWEIPSPTVDNVMRSNEVLGLDALPAEGSFNSLIDETAFHPILCKYRL